MCLQRCSDRSLVLVARYYYYYYYYSFYYYYSYSSSSSSTYNYAYAYAYSYSYSDSSDRILVAVSRCARGWRLKVVGLDHCLGKLESTRIRIHKRAC